MTNDSVQYQIKGIEILDVQLIYPENPQEKLEKYGFEISLEHKVNFSSKIVFVVPKITIINDLNKSVLGSIRISCAYQVENFDQFADEAKGTINFPKYFELAINTVSISTARGIMFGQFRGTLLQNAILPVIDPNSLNQKKEM
ncbi:MAG: hypothetical protein WCX31_06305 [Salinivirgaceae bacterium]|jgi:hypothetical protein